MAHHWYLKSCDLFQRLPEDELAQLEACSRYRTFAARSVIYLPADHADAVVTLVSGRVKLCHATADGKESILALIEPGEVFGELCLLSGDDREELAIAMEKSSAVLIPRQAMQKVVDRHAELALGITRLVGFRRQRIERRLRYLLFHPNRDRLIHLLLELLEKYGRTAPGGTLIGIKLSHQDLASIIGSTRETVTATLGELQEQGFIELGRQKIIVHSVSRLAAEVEERQGANFRQ